MAQIRAGDPSAGVATLLDWLQGHPDDIKARFNLANIYLLLNKPDKAREEFARLDKLGAEDASILNNLAWLTKDVDLDQSLTFAEKALALKPDSPVVKDTLGVILLKQKKTERALRLLKEANQSMPDNLDIKYHLALAYHDTGDLENASQILKEAIGSAKPFAEREHAKSLLNALNKRN